MQELCVCFLHFTAPLLMTFLFGGDIVCFLAMFTPYIGMILFGIGLFTTCKSDSDKNDESDKKENE